MSASLSNTTRRRLGMIAALAILPFMVGQSPARATVVSATGSAYGYHKSGVTLFGNPDPDDGPTPAVALASDASNSPQNASAATANVTAGPGGVATLLTTDQISVSTSGSLGTTGSVTSSSSLQNVNKATSQATSGSEILTADEVRGTCTASESAATASTALTNATLRTDSGLDQNGNGNYTDPGDHPPVLVNLPATPSVNQTFTGHIHIGTAVDDFTVVLNEQSTAGGVLTVTAVHEILGTNPPDSLTGHLYLGRSVCGVTGAPPTDVGISTVTSSPTTVAPGGQVTYAITISNAGPADAVGVSVQANLSNAKFVSASAGCTIATKGKVRPIVCSVPTITPGNSATVTVTAAAPKKTGTMGIDATLTAANDSTPANNTGTAATPIVKP